jgi:hypothetical protein
MSKNTKLNNRQKAALRKLLEKKCTELGILDQQLWRPTGSRKPFFKKADGGGFVLKDGQPQVFMEQTNSLVNPQRQLVKKLLESSESAIAAFLVMTPKDLPKNG